MKVRELIELLKECDLDGQVSFTLPADVIDGTDYDDGAGYVYVPLVQALWSTKAMEARAPADHVQFEIPSLKKRDN